MSSPFTNRFDSAGDRLGQHMNAFGTQHRQNESRSMATAVR
jgi:hypothetical protein